MFVLRANVPPDRWWLRLKFQFLVARDHAFIFIIVQLVNYCNYVSNLLIHFCVKVFNSRLAECSSLLL